MDGSSKSGLKERYDFARDLARQVGREALRFWNEKGVDGLGTQTKGLQDFVTKADKAAEQTIRSELERMFPGDGFVGEETGETPAWPDTGWLTRLMGPPITSAVCATGAYPSPMYPVVRLNLVSCTIHRLTEFIMPGLGMVRTATNNQSLYPQRLTRMPAMGILGYSRRIPIDAYLHQIRALYDAGVEHRRIGSAAIGIVRVAEGVADYYYEAHLNSWDALAAVLIAKEAGGVARVPPIDQFVADGGEVFCATPALAELLFDLLTSAPGVSK